MHDYIGKIQEEFRRNLFPLEKSVRRVNQVSLGPDGLQVTGHSGWEYRTADERWSITVYQDSVAVQCTAYSKFEDFAERLKLAISTVFSITEHDEFGRVERVGLRYINLIRPNASASYRDYLQPGFHGAGDRVFLPASARLAIETLGQTGVAQRLGVSDELNSKMLLRIIQNDAGHDLPPDVIETAPKYTSRAKPNELVTIIDVDHFIEGNAAADVEWILDRAYELHDEIIENFHEHIVTEHALKEWK